METPPKQSGNLKNAHVFLSTDIDKRVEKIRTVSIKNLWTLITGLNYLFITYVNCVMVCAFYLSAAHKNTAVGKSGVAHAMHHEQIIIPTNDL